MTQAKLRFSTIEEYLAYDDGTDTRYELVDGVLVNMGSEKRLNEKIALWLLSQFLQVVSIDLIARGTQIAVKSSSVTARNPDLMILTEDLDQMLSQQNQSLITANMPAPVLIVEVVSPGEPGSENYDRDYIDKRREYAERGILEYWIIDPARSVVTVLRLDGKQYQEVGQFQDSDIVLSPSFPQLNLTAMQILKSG
ncbi:Uma2 family endonuclease [Leptolyngbya sp. GGD]|uniref:Uma2 family endonuclease n=1 Tax=Leptolyngbya sp. GGD TaxID=2997907 RepID=UPI00227C52A7|nr:Uma2 family endonuclease [Leptolyngbya sp. GGD]MCY6489699.1 Uma2 family endonuclease [Leptolyngbya sp. GGD]